MQPPLNQPLRNSAKTVKSSEYRHPLTECHCHQGRRQLPLLIIDEAHDLRNDVLEELRLLTSYDLRAHRLRLAGCSQALFEPTAVEALSRPPRACCGRSTASPTTRCWGPLSTRPAPSRPRTSSARCPKPARAPRCSTVPADSAPPRPAAWPERANGPNFGEVGP